MAKSSKKGKSTRRPTKAELAQQKQVRELWVRLAIVATLLFGASRMGVFGMAVYNSLRLLFGSTAYVVMAVAVVGLLFPKRLLAKKATLAGVSLFLVGLLLEFHAAFALKATADASIGGTLSLALGEWQRMKVSSFLGGGLFGAALYQPISYLFANLGTFFIGGVLLVIGLFMVGPWSVYDVADFLSLWREKQEEARLRIAEKRALKDAQKPERLAQEAAAQALELEPEPVEEERVDELAVVDTEESGPSILVADEEREDEFPVLLAEDAFSPEVEATPEEEPFQMAAQTKEALAYRLPSIELFAPVRSKSQAGEKKIVRQNIKVLEETFASFGIKVTVERAEIGPSVTKYEVKPAVGVRVSRISNLADDLALALAAKDVRIEAPIPGKSLVGIEVPNAEIATVSFRELWEQSQTDANKLLEIPLGKAVNGQSRSFDLARMPHLLVAGSTGSGKSVAVNGIIASILMKARPDEVKFMMIDPKMVELSVYNDIPHLLIPVVTNPRKAARALQKVVDEMEKRYELFSQIGVRNIAGYNAKVAEFNARSVEKQIPLPLVVVIVDELADLMMVASKEVEDAIIRLGQKARAAGIHMILATQRPSVDVISGLIKANVPSRIAFAVSSGTDSRTILDENGAEKLLGRGDMLFKPIDENHPVRLQGSFISDDEVERLVTFVKGQGAAEYDEAFDPGDVADTDSDTGSADEGGDPLFEEARALVVETQKASASMIQRRLSVGFNRATRLMEDLEAAGVIGPAEGTKPRKVLETP